MKIAEMNERIVIQKSRMDTDTIGNHTLKWFDYYYCWACVDHVSGKKFWEAAQHNARDSLYFTIRYFSPVHDLDTTHYRVKFRGQIYNITFIDHSQYKNKMLRLMAERADRE